VAFYFLLKTSQLPQKEEQFIPPPIIQKAPHNLSLQSSANLETPTATVASEERPQESISIENDSTRSTPATTDIVVPSGARVPAVLMDGGGPNDSPETAAIINVIIEEFAAKIDEAKRVNRNEEEAWEEAREVADDRYRQFFGFEAFNEATLEAAGEAYEESSAENLPPVR
jgi:hypothetical protein